MTRAHRIAVLSAVAFVAAAPASAELYRCTGPDGKTLFTDQKGVCPDADPHELRGEVMKAPTPPARPAPVVDRQRAIAAEQDEANAESWRARKRQAEERIAQIEQQREYLKRYVSHCNRGGYVMTRDDAGIEQNVNCSRLKREFAALDVAEEEARDYLQNVLPEECRKAGCLPGWLRD